jgi:hypothetical protein
MNRRAYGLALLLAALLVRPAGAAEPIDRELVGLRLGMSVQQFAAAAGGTEEHDEFQGLMPGERLFRVDPKKLPDNVKDAGARFYNDQLYKISVEFKKEFSEGRGWDGLIGAASGRYGTIEIKSQPIRNGFQDIARWEDPATAYMVLRQRVMRFKERKMVETGQIVVVLLDRAVWDQRLNDEQEAYSLF